MNVLPLSPSPINPSNHDSPIGQEPGPIKERTPPERSDNPQSCGSLQPPASSLQTSHLSPGKRCLFLPRASLPSVSCCHGSLKAPPCAHRHGLQRAAALCAGAAVVLDGARHAAPCGGGGRAEPAAGQGGGRRDLLRTGPSDPGVTHGEAHPPVGDGARAQDQADHVGHLR